MLNDVPRVVIRQTLVGRIDRAESTNTICPNHMPFDPALDPTMQRFSRLILARCGSGHVYAGTDVMDHLYDIRVAVDRSAIHAQHRVGYG